MTAAIKTVGDTTVGDTITLANNPAAKPLPGYRKMNPMVFCGLYPIDSGRFNDLREALEKLELNDSALNMSRSRHRHLALASVVDFLGFSYGNYPRTD